MVVMAAPMWAAGEETSPFTPRTTKEGYKVVCRNGETMEVPNAAPEKEGKCPKKLVCLDEAAENTYRLGQETEWNFIEGRDYVTDIDENGIAGSACIYGTEPDPTPEPEPNPEPEPEPEPIPVPEPEPTPEPTTPEDPTPASTTPKDCVTPECVYIEAVKTAEPMEEVVFEPICYSAKMEKVPCKGVPKIVPMPSQSTAPESRVFCRNNGKCYLVGSGLGAVVASISIPEILSPTTLVLNVVEPENIPIPIPSSTQPRNGEVVTFATYLPRAIEGSKLQWSVIYIDCNGKKLPVKSGEVSLINGAPQGTKVDTTFKMVVDPNVVPTGEYRIEVGVTGRLQYGQSLFGTSSFWVGTNPQEPILAFVRDGIPVIVLGSAQTETEFTWKEVIITTSSSDKFYLRALVAQVGNELSLGGNRQKLPTKRRYDLSVVGTEIVDGKTVTTIRSYPNVLFLPFDLSPGLLLQ